MSTAAKHKETLVHTAMRLFRRQGYASTGLKQILEESGAPKGSLYYYFPEGKEALAEAAVDLAGGLILEMLTELSTKHKAPTAFLKGYCKTLAGWMKESDFRSGCPIATTLLETAPDSERIRAAGERAVDSWIEVIAGVLERGTTKKKDARTKAQSIVAAMEGALILSRVRQSDKPIMDVAVFL